MNKGQLSAEFLILLAAVLLISVIIVKLVTTPAAENKENYLLSTCQTAAQQCKFIHRADSNYSCNFCEEQCVYSDSGEEIFQGAVNCCKQGNFSQIYKGSNGC